MTRAEEQQDVLLVLKASHVVDGAGLPNIVIMLIPMASPSSQIESSPYDGRGRGGGWGGSGDI